MAVNQGGLLLKVIVFDPDLVWTGNRTDYLYLQAFFERSRLDSPFLKAGLPITQELTPILFDIDREWKEQKPGYQLLIKAHLLKLLANCFRGKEQLPEAAVLSYPLTTVRLATQNAAT